MLFTSENFFSFCFQASRRKLRQGSVRSSERVNSQDSHKEGEQRLRSVPGFYCYTSSPESKCPQCFVVTHGFLPESPPWKKNWFVSCAVTVKARDNLLDGGEDR